MVPSTTFTFTLPNQALTGHQQKSGIQSLRKFKDNLWILMLAIFGEARLT